MNDDEQEDGDAVEEEKEEAQGEQKGRVATRAGTGWRTMAATALAAALKEAAAASSSNTVSSQQGCG